MKTYCLVCHGCGRLHSKEAYFMSTPLSFAGDTSVGRWSIPMAGCGQCDRETIGNAYRNGMSPAAREAAVKSLEHYVSVVHPSL